MKWLLPFVLLAGCVKVSTDWRPSSDPFVIRADGGGRIIEYEARRRVLERAGTEVRITGKCYSACTIYTTLPNACVSKRAQIGFHGASVSLGPIGDEQMGKYYRGEVLRLYNEDWRHLSGPNELHIISGAELKRIDPEIRICQSAS